MILTFRPLTNPLAHWGEEGRKPSLFKSSYADTLAQLEEEIWHLGATDVFLQVIAAPTDVRLNGQLRANAKVEHPGVILTIDTEDYGTLVYETDRFTGTYNRPSWQQNLRAITLGLAALRKIERYGIAKRGQQYAGYRELGAGTPMPAASMTLEDAAALLMPKEPQWILDADLGDMKEAFRQLSKSAHPDAGGDPETFRHLTEARDLLLKNLGR